MPSAKDSSRLDAALALVEAGYKIFPVPPGTKKSYVAQKSRHGSGEAWGMTGDPELVKQYWKRWPNANIGLPTGAVNGVIVIETDSPKGHANLKVDGETSLKAAESRLGALPATRIAESPSGSRHRFYVAPEARVKNSASELGPGIDVRGDGGMVVAPPSVRKDGAYVWINSLDIVELPPKWVAELASKRESAPPTLPDDANWAEEYGFERGELPDLEEVEAALADIPNENVGWEKWNDVGMRIYAATGGSDQGLLLFDQWSRQSPSYDRANTRKKWQLFHRAPPTRYTAQSIISLAEYGFDYDEGGENAEAKEWQAESNKEDPLHEVNGHPAEAVSDIPGHILIPYNFWDEYKTPDVPRGVFPKIIEKLATTLSEVRGSDPAGLAMGGLLACGAAIPDCYKIQPKPRSDPSWMEDPRIWVAMVGGVASIKTSTVKTICAPFVSINDEMYVSYTRALARYNKLDKKEQAETEEPQCSRILISDINSQECQNILRYNEDGIFNKQDELGHFFGSLDQFTHGGGSGTERTFWTQTYEGGSYLVDRVNKQRKFMIKNCGVSLYGGIQPDVIRRYGDNSANDGLLQRCLFVMLKKAVADRDIPAPPVQEEYDNLIRRLHELPRGRIPPLNFTADASKVRERFVEKTMELGDLYGGWNSKLGEHISKWRGMFCRVCLIIHMTETMDDESNIDVDVAERVYRLFLDYLLPHSEAFYLGVLNTAGETGKLKAIAEFILAHNRAEIGGRDLLTMVRATRGLTSKEVDLVFQQLFYLSWITPGEKKRSDSTTWIVNPKVHQLFDATAVETRRRNEKIRDEIMARRMSKMHAMGSKGR